MHSQPTSVNLSLYRPLFLVILRYPSDGFEVNVLLLAESWDIFILKIRVALLIASYGRIPQLFG